MIFFESLLAFLFSLFVSATSATVINHILASPRASAIEPRQTSHKVSCDRVACINALVSLPIKITTCVEAQQDLNVPSSKRDPIRTTSQIADCIAEATFAGLDISGHCAGCTQVVDGECPAAQYPCTGIPA